MQLQFFRQEAWDGVTIGQAYFGSLALGVDGVPKFIFFDDNGNWQAINAWYFRPIGI